MYTFRLTFFSDVTTSSTTTCPPLFLYSFLLLLLPHREFFGVVGCVVVAAVVVVVGPLVYFLFPKQRSFFFSLLKSSLHLHLGIALLLFLEFLLRVHGARTSMCVSIYRYLFSLVFCYVSLFLCRDSQNETWKHNTRFKNLTTRLFVLSLFSHSLYLFIYFITHLPFF